MKSRHGWFIRVVLSMALLLESALVSAFPEIPFCPLGGPPGWWNRIFDDDHGHPPPPLWYPPPPSAPYWAPTTPYGYLPDWRHQPPPVTR
ncbi:MAG: hypothetical protein KJP15_02330 [Gammaproteobacteria bacterium]|nr:hypothetical protein [Gammaproteobacteria bacterium]